MARVFVALNNFCRIKEDYCAMPPFFESFLHGLQDAGNDVKCFQTKAIAGIDRFKSEMPDEYTDMLKEFNPDLCIMFNNNFWDISNVVDCPIVIYDVDSPLEWQLKEGLIENIDRYLFVYNQTKGRKELFEYFHASEQQCCYIPFFTEIRANPNIKAANNIVFLGTNWTWKGYNFLNKFIKSNPSEDDVQKAMEMLRQYIKEPLKPAHELYYELGNCPHERMNLGDLSRCSFEISGLRRVRALDAVTDLGLEVNGYYWTIDMMNYFPELLSCVRGKQIWTKQQSEDYYNAARIAMNTNHIQAENGFSFRVCDILASNACLVSEYSSDLEDLFPDVDIPFFTTPAEAREQCKRLLDNENLRLDIVAAAHETIDKKFRFKNVLQSLEEFTGLCLHPEKEGTLEIFPSSEETANSNHQKVISSVVPPAPAKKKDVLSPMKKAYYNTLGKHLGYDPYHRFGVKYIRIGKLRLFKILKIDNLRKELYMGFLPLVSYNQESNGAAIRILFFEKVMNGLRKLKNHLASNGKIPRIQVGAMKKNLQAQKKKKHLKRLKEKWNNGGSIKVCLFVSRITCWMFEDIYHLLKESGKFEPVIVVKPFMSRGMEYMKECMNSTYDELVERGYSPIKGYDEETDSYLDVRVAIDPDIVFYTKFWKPHFHPNFYIDAFRDRMSLLIDYGYNVTGHVEAMNFELQNDVDIYFYYSPIQKEIAAKYMRNKAKNVVITGAPKLDPLFDKNYAPTDPWKKQNKPKKRIIWAPHHEDKTAKNMYQLDAFYDLYKIMLEIAETYKDEIQIAFKPHPLLKVKLLNRWGEEATEKYYEQWENLGNGQLEEGDYIDLFLTSDAMILDCLSFIAEYSATGKPALFTVGSKSRVLLNDLGNDIYKLMYHAKDNLKAEICAFIENVVIAENDELKEERLEFVKENILPPNNETAAKNVYNSICNYIVNGGRNKP